MQIFTKANLGGFTSRIQFIRYLTDTRN